jgi:hypothetical protein
MIFMIEHTIESTRSLPFIGCKSGPSKWLEDLSKAIGFSRSIQNMENAALLLEDSQIYELIYPAQLIMSDRLFEEISRRNKDNEPEKFKFREQENFKKVHEPSKTTTTKILLSTEEYKANLEKSGLRRENRKKSTGYDLKDRISQAELEIKLSTDLTEIENKFPVKSDVREKILRNIINMHSKEIKDNQLGHGLNILKQSLQSPSPTLTKEPSSVEKIHVLSKKPEDMNSSKSVHNSFDIKEEYSPAGYFRNFLSEKMSERFSRNLRGIPELREFLEKNSGKINESNLIKSNKHFEVSFADYHMQDLKPPDSEKQLIKNNKSKANSERISDQFSRPIEGIAISKRYLEEELRDNSGQNTNFSTSSTSYSPKNLKSKSNQISEKIKNPFYTDQFDSNQFDKIFISGLKSSENNRDPDILYLTSVNMLIEEAYSNSVKKSDIKEENRELLLNLIENLHQVMNQTNRDTAPLKQNIFNIHVSGGSPIGEDDLKNLSDKLVLVLKDQARRHGIDLS